MDKSLKLSFSIETILDLLFQIKEDRTNLTLEIERLVRNIEEIKEFYEDRFDLRVEEKNELEYEILKLKSQVVDLQNELEAYKKKYVLLLPIAK